MPVAAAGSSALGFYVKLAIAMLVVGGISYRPSLIGAALPFVGIALFWFGAYAVLRNGRRGLAQRAGRRGTHPVAAGASGPHIDLTAPVRSSGQGRGVI